MKKGYTKEDILRMVEEEDVEFIRLQFTDMFGCLKNMAITVSQLEKALNNQCMFDGSSIEGFARIEESDMYLYPDLDTFTILPWRPQPGTVARLICDVYRSDGTPFQGDPRQVLKKAVAHAAELGYEFEVGPECEFFLFNVDENGRPSTESYEQAGYFDLDPQEIGENARRDMVLTLEDMGLGVEASHHEAAPAQHEIDLKYDEAISTADNLMTFKMAVKTIAKRHGLHATFMPKPKFGINGSGMHINMSLNRDGQNIFNDPSGELGLSKEAYYFMGGIKVNLGSKTSMKGLYACGETSCNGVHGRNRLASNSLVESLVFAERAAKKMAAEWAAEGLTENADRKETATEPKEDEWKLLAKRYDIRKEDYQNMEEYAECCKESIWDAIRKEDEYESNHKNTKCG